MCTIAARPESRLEDVIAYIQLCVVRGNWLSACLVSKVPLLTGPARVPFYSRALSRIGLFLCSATHLVRVSLSSRLPSLERRGRRRRALKEMKLKLHGSPLPLYSIKEENYGALKSRKRESAQGIFPIFQKRKEKKRKVFHPLQRLLPPSSPSFLGGGERKGEKLFSLVPFHRFLLLLLFPLS